MRRSTPFRKVLAVPDGIVARGEDRSEDLERKRNIEAALHRDLRLIGATIDVRVQGSEAVLHGKLPSSTARMAAEFDAWAVRGIGRVKNRLKVDSGDVEPLRDPQVLQEEAVHRIAAEPDLAGTEVEIKASEGKLTLTGYVSSQEQEQKVHGIALRVAGVLEVINKISIIPVPDENDQRIGKEINDRLYRDIYVDVNTVDVHVQRGTVALGGYVERAEDLKRVKRLAKIPGVKKVILNLMVAEGA